MPSSRARLARLAVLTVTLLSALPAGAAATTIYATPAGGGSGASCSDGTSAQSAIAGAVAGDIVHLCAGTFAVPSGGLGVTANNLTIEGEGSSTSIVDGTGVASTQAMFGVAHDATFRNLAIRNHTQVNAPGAGIYAYGSGVISVSGATFSNLKVTGSGSDGGAIYAGKTVVSDSAFSGNSAENRGGAIFTSSTGADSLTISRSSLSDNHVLPNPASGYKEGDGGATWSGGRVTLNDALLQGNSVSINRAGVAGGSQLRGGAIFAESVEMTGSTLSDNSVTVVEAGSSSALGGGAFVVDTFDATESVIKGNLAKVTGSSYPQPWGGGVAGEGNSEATLTDSSLSDNSGVIESPTGSGNAQGGGMRMGRGVTLVRSTVSGNVTPRYGGGMWVQNLTAGPTHVVALNSTISGNQAADGSALFAYRSTGAQPTVLLENTTVAGNTATDPGGAAIWSYSGSLEVTNSIVSNEDGCDWDTGFSPALGDGGNVISDASGSCDAFGTAPFGKMATSSELALGPLAANGGPTQTMALGANSSAIGAAVADRCPATDQRGVTRAASTCDSGAFQLSTSPAPGPSPGPEPSPDPEPGPQPEPGPAPGPGPMPRPSNAFTVRKVRAVGSSVITKVTVPGPGTLVLKATRKVKAAARVTACRSSKGVTRARNVVLSCKANSATRKAQQRGPVRLSVRVTYTPRDGTSRTSSPRTVVLKGTQPSYTG